MVFSFQSDLLAKLQEVEGPSYTRILYVNDYTIYGSGGLNRYFINVGNIHDGFELNEVIFSAFHSDDNGIEKAKLAGFNVLV